MTKSPLTLLPKILLLALGSISLWMIYLALQVPSNDHSWQTQFEILPTIDLSGDNIDIRNVRDFRYNDDDTISRVSYLDQNFKLSEFRDAWFGISHFGDHGLAHVLISFEFSKDQFLVVSIEARLQQKDVEGYDPIKGLFRGYTKTIVLATEEDVIGLRTHVRGEPLYLYRLNLPELYTKPLLLNFLREAQALTTKPTFYNTFVDNCMTGLLAQSDRFRSFWSWLDMRIMLPGNSDEIAYEMSYIDTSDSFTKVREDALVNPKLTAIGNPDFSRRIRE